MRSLVFCIELKHKNSLLCGHKIVATRTWKRRKPQLLPCAGKTQSNSILIIYSYTRSNFLQGVAHSWSMKCCWFFFSYRNLFQLDRKTWACGGLIFQCCTGPSVLDGQFMMSIDEASENYRTKTKVGNSNHNSLCKLDATKQMELVMHIKARYILSANKHYK